MSNSNTQLLNIRDNNINNLFQDNTIEYWYSSKDSNTGEIFTFECKQPEKWMNFFNVEVRKNNSCLIQ